MTPQIILLTGGSSGIGYEMAVQLMNKGAKVYATSRRISTALKSEQNDGEIIPVQLDVNDSAKTRLVVDDILRTHGKLNAVICNAGNGVAGAVEDTSEEEVRYQMETNFFGVVKTINACLPVFRQQGYGKIMVTSSVAAIVPIPYQAFYSAGKSAVLSYMQALSLEVKPFGIQCCTALPGDTKTSFTAARKFTEASQMDSSAYATRMKKSVGKMIKDEENGLSPSKVAHTMVKEICRNKMRPMVIPGIQYKVICGLFNLIPVRIRLWAVEKLY